MNFLRSLTLKGRLIAGAAALLFIIAVCAGLYFSGKRDGKASERVKQAEIATQAVTQAREADEAAQTAVSTERASTAASEAKAREAAEKSDDPLRAGLDSLRNEK